MIVGFVFEEELAILAWRNEWMKMNERDERNYSDGERKLPLLCRTREEKKRMKMNRKDEIREKKVCFYSVSLIG